MSVLEELKIKLGWDVDTKSLDKAGHKTQKLAKQSKSDWAAVGKSIKMGYAAVAVAVVAATAALAAFTNQMADQLNEIDKNSKALGVSTKEYQELKFAMGQAGLEAGSLKSGLEKFNAGLNDARLNGAGPFADSLKQMGMQVEDFNGLPVTEQLALFADGFATLTDQTTKTGIAQKVLTTDFVGLLEGGGSAIRGLTEEAGRLGIASDEQIKKAAALKDAMGRFDQTLFSIKATLAEELFPIFEAVVAAMQEWLAENRAWLKSGLQEGMQKLAVFGKEVWRILVLIWDVLDPIIKILVGPSLDLALDNFKSLAKVLGAVKDVLEIAQIYLGKFMGYLGDVVDSLSGGFFSGVIDGVTSSFQNMADAISWVGNEIREVISLFLQMAKGPQNIELADEDVSSFIRPSFIPTQSRSRKAATKEAKKARGSSRGGGKPSRSSKGGATLASLTGDPEQPDFLLSAVTKGAQPQVLTSIINNNFNFDNEFNIEGSGDPNAVGESVVESFRTYFQETVEATTRSVKVNFAR